MSTAPIFDSEGDGTDEGSFLERCRREYTFSLEATEAQRTREVEDLKFQLPELQWDPGAKAAREGDGTVPAQPCLSVSKISEPIRLVMNQARAAKLGVSIHPVSEDANEDTAHVYEGLYSRIQRDSNADEARLWALDRAVKCGTGWYRVNVKVDEDSFDWGDLEVSIDRIQHQSCVFPDPSAQKPDYSDGNFLFVVSWVQIDTFKRQYKGSRFSQATGFLETSNIIKEAPGWVKGTGASQAVMVAEVFHRYTESETMYVGPRGKATKDKPKRGEYTERTRDKVTVRRAVVTGYDVLEPEKDWYGRYIPFIPVLGRELQPFDDQRRIEGMIRPARDAQKSFNYFLSSFVQRVALEPKVPYVGPEGTFEGHPEWQLANVKNYAFLEYKPIMVGGQIAPEPHRMQLDTTGMSMAHQGILLGTDLLQSSTATYDPSLGKATSGESGRHALALQSQSDAGTSDFLDQLSHAMRYEALVVMDLIPPVYDAPGRVVTILGKEDDKPEKVMLNKPFTMDQATGKPVAARKGEKNVKHYDFSKGRYGVAATIGKSNQTRLQEGGEQIARFVEAAPQLAEIVAPTYLKFQDFPGSEELAELLWKVLDTKYPGLRDNGQETPDVLKGKLQAQTQQLQQMQQQLQQAGQIIQTKHVETQGRVEVEKAKLEAQVGLESMKFQHAIVLQQMKDATQIEMARISAEKDALDAANAANEERIALHTEQAHEVGMAAMGQAHAQEAAQMAGAQDAAAQASDQQHQAGMQEQAQGHDAAQADADRQAAAEQAAQQAAAGDTGVV